MRKLIQDLNYALRQFTRTPGVAVTAIISLALGIGATTAVFSVVYGVLGDPYPYRDANRMVHVQLNLPERHGPLLMVTGPQYDDLRKLSAIDDVFLQTDERQSLTGDQLPISVQVGKYSPNLFDYMGVPIYTGRGFSPADVTNGKPAPVAVLSYLFWRRQFGSNREILGKSIELDHVLYSVIGVAPPRFTWGDSDVYLPAIPSSDPHEYWNAFVKLKPGTRYPPAEAELQIFVDRISQQDPNFPKNAKVKIVSLNEQVLGKFQGALTILFAAVVILLLIGCANVSILLLARGNARQHELAVRVAVGAGRARLVRQLLTESVLLSVSGTLLGVLAAYFGVDAISALLPRYSFPHEAAIHISGVVLGFSAGVALLTGIIFGISPAWQLSRPQLGSLIQANNMRQSGSIRSRNTHRLLIAGQVALTIILLATAGASARAFIARTHTPLGLDPNNVFGIDLALPKGAHPTWQDRVNANEEIRRTIEQVPGITSVGVSTSWFPPFGGFTGPIEIQSKPGLTQADVNLALISPQLFTTLRVPLLQGRNFSDAEVQRGDHLALVNQAFVKQYLGDADPIGQSVRSSVMNSVPPIFLMAQKPADWLQVIGVVGDAKNDGLDHPVKPAVYIPYTFVLPPDETLMIRSAGDPDAALKSVRVRLHDLNPEIVLGDEHTLTWWLNTDGWGRERFIASLFGVFAGLALVLASTGLYSVVSYAVTQRTQELGIRMALGAPRASIFRLVLSSTAVTLGIGAAVGLGISIALGRIVASMAGASSRDPLTLAAATALLFVVAAAACLLPARRAASIDPIRALRTE